MFKRSFVVAAVLVSAILVAAAATSTSTSARDVLLQRISSTTAQVQKYIDLLKSPRQATRVAALSQMIRSRDPAVVELAVETGLASRDRAMRAIAIRAAFRQVRSIVAKVSVPRVLSQQARAVLKHCGNAVQYTIEGYNNLNGQFEVRGQDQTGVGNVSGSSLSLTIDYGCSLTGVIESNGRFNGMVSAPYRKGSLPARFIFR